MKISAGILIYRLNQKQLEVFLIHPGGPFWKNKDYGAWSIPKGENSDKDGGLFQTALRELKKETGIDLLGKSEKDFINLDSVVYKGHKLDFILYRDYKKVYAWAIEHNLPENFELKSNLLEIEFKKGSGKKYSFPEVDRGEFFLIETAKQKIHPAQKELIERLERIVAKRK